MYDHDKIKDALGIGRDTKISIKQVSGGYKIDVISNTNDVLNLAKSASNLYWFGNSKIARCVKCNTQYKIHYHHIIFRSAGGEDDPDNLLPLCFNCHVGDNGIHSNKWNVDDLVGIDKMNELRSRYGIKHS